MLRSELVSCLLQENTSLSVPEVEHIVSTFFDEIVSQLRKGGRVELRGFGIFSARSRDARLGRNPRTGEAVEVASTIVPYFKPAKDIRHRLNHQ
ncbi:HU family DNA-binding protein [uncultured Sphingomonas sp.]|uniref:HU family DNA-binding protein n=1 Tax=uncultured Sphingomonas sp. TaxID=158754 RepID=UPI0025D8023D|nr:HU family DNA-binding protein [uncultured Sphingomonas sp.]